MASMSSVTTRGFSLSGGFAGSAALIVTLGYGQGEAAEVAYYPPRFTIARRNVATLDIERLNVQTADIARRNVATLEIER